MISLKRILVPTDFSDSSRSATRYACGLAEQFDAELHLLHVLETHAVSTPQFGLGFDLPTFVRESRKAAETALMSGVAPDWEVAHRVVRTVVEGSPFVEIVRYAQEKAIDLIVLSTHGRSGLVQALMGSVAEKVVRKAPCPVLTVRPEGHQFVMP